mmetsp:Transcript_19478/g.42041  ORF Transcript_19478/g.42041 Transcript_19478/m.42041 type:complete len:91 (-) Transcript_19478:1085-1357(-)
MADSSETSKVDCESAEAPAAAGATERELPAEPGTEMTLVVLGSETDQTAGGPRPAGNDLAEPLSAGGGGTYELVWDDEAVAGLVMPLPSG